MTAKATANSNVTTIEIGIDTAERAENLFRQTGRLHCIALHGDYRYDNLKNTAEELRTQNARLQEKLIAHLGSANLLVVGYSGRDRSIMDALTSAYSQEGYGRLFWVGYGEDSLADANVVELIQTARNYGREAFYVPSSGFDDLMWRVVNKCLDSQYTARIQEIYTTYNDPKHQSSPALKTVKLGKKAKISELIKSNSFELECPNEILQFSAKDFDGPGAWSRLRQQISDCEVVAGLLRGKILACGSVESIRAAFGSKLTGPIERVPISKTDLSYENGVIIQILTTTLILAISKTRNLQTDGRRTIWQRQSSGMFHTGGETYKVFDAANLVVRQISSEMRLIIEPTIKLLTQVESPVPKEVQAAARRDLLAKQFNRIFNDKLDEWRNTLFDSDHSIFTFPGGQADGNFLFRVKKIPDFASIVEFQPKYPVSLPDSIQKHIRHRGMKFQEPSLLFGRLGAEVRIKDTNALRGLSMNKPFDHSLTRQGIEPDVRLGIVCPQQNGPALQNFLLQLQQGSKVSSNKEYMVDFRGFDVEFGLPLRIPSHEESRWKSCPEIDQSLSVQQGAAELRNNIIQSINSLIASGAPSLILIFVPKRWAKWEAYAENNEFLTSIILLRHIA